MKILVRTSISGLISFIKNSADMLEKNNIKNVIAQVLLTTTITFNSYKSTNIYRSKVYETR